MSVIEEVFAKRRKLAEVLQDADYSGIREIVEQLYPDRAHFIYELLQNAEDTGATEACFQIERDRLTFQHNGRPFDARDISRITNIGKSSKAEEQDKIGRFGVGFKAVFAYSETPHIWSPTYSFRIESLVLPVALQSRSRELGESTRFEFPFNNPKKSAADAYAEIRNGLTSLADLTLLFLAHLQSVQWQSADGEVGELRRIQHSEHHIEIVKRNERRSNSSHFLRFIRTVDGLETHRVAVAFALDPLPAIKGFDRSKPLSKQLKIIPAEPGRVAVFFPAEKEASGLRFHLHAPFVPELSRASIKETPANEPLFGQLASLAAQCLHHIRDMGLLTVDFLSVLPNPQDDQIPVRYQCIRHSIIEEMNGDALTPTHGRSHAPAKNLLQAKASLKDLLVERDLEFLLTGKFERPRWAAGATQKNSNTDRFLAGLAVTQWDVDAFVELLLEMTSERWRFTNGRMVKSPDAEFAAWLSEKPVEWHQRLYAFLYAELSANSECNQLRAARIVRLSDGSYSVGPACFFPNQDTRHDDILPRVDARVFSSSKSKTQQANARKLLEAVGVREIGEREQIEAILRQRYAGEGFRPRKHDIRRFVSLVEKDSTSAGIFADYCIFEAQDEKWRTPSDIFIDEPLIDTGLRAYYEYFAEEAARVALSPSYADCGVAVSRIVKFSEAVGAQTRLAIQQITCRSNPQYAYLRSVPGERYTSPIDKDFVVPGLDAILEKPSIPIARLIWRTMSALPARTECLKATFQKNESWGSRVADSQLVHQLRKAAWVPQGDVFVRPEEAIASLLPDGFAFDPGSAWIKAVGFGRIVEVKSEEQRRRETAAKELGFRDQASLERARRFAALPSEEQERLLSQRERAAPIELPEQEPTNPERRAERVAKRAAVAPGRGSEERSRSVSIGIDDVKEESRLYLRQQYTDPDGAMICQVCKTQMPFKLDDGTDYFETVEFLPELRRRHYQNYLALCPNHSAMARHANHSVQSLQSTFISLQGNELDVVLAGRETTIYFTRTHIMDLKEVIKVDQLEEGGESVETGLAQPI